MGFIRLKQDMPNESLAFFRKAIEQDPFLPDHHIGVGLAYLKMNDTKNAFKYLNHSKAFLNRSYPNQGSKQQGYLGLIHAGLGLVYQKKGLYQQAEEEFRIAESVYTNPINDVSDLIS